jgi:hypothetical protein
VPKRYLHFGKKVHPLVFERYRVFLLVGVEGLGFPGKKMPITKVHRTGVLLYTAL